jgi:hypothetical protein
MTERILQGNEDDAAYPQIIDEEESWFAFRLHRPNLAAGSFPCQLRLRRWRGLARKGPQILVPISPSQLHTLPYRMAKGAFRNVTLF